MLSFLQTRLGLGGADDPTVVRINQYRRRMETVDAPGAWFHESFKNSLQILGIGGKLNV
jgi:hypothetical protein